MNRRFYTFLAVAAMFLMGHSVSAQTTFSYTGTLQTYTVPAGVGNIQIECTGGAGGDNVGTSMLGGHGAYISGEFVVTPGQVLNIMVAGQGENADNTGGGGGGSFVWDNSSSTLLIAAGGGGGCSWASGGLDGSLTEDGTNAPGATDGAGTGGMGGTPPSFAQYASGGAGWLSDGSDGTIHGCSSNSTGGQTPLSGGAGGAYGGNVPYVGAGGYGGGGGGNGKCGAVGGGGGGGYSGGGPGHATATSFSYQGGGGGGSYNSGTAPVAIAGVGTGDGVIVITELCVGLTSSVSDDTVCVGDPVTLSATSTGTGTVSWDGGVIDGTPFTPPLGATTYTATSTDPNDCDFVVTIFVGDFPTVDAGLDQDVCEGDSTSLAGSGTATDWSWDGGILDGVNFLPPAGTTTYTLTGTIDSTGCQATDMVDVTVVTIDLGISASGTVLTANQSGATYQWLDCPGLTPIAGETNQSFTPSADGDYAVAVTVSGCTDTTACQGVFAGITDNGIAGMKVYPNPTDGIVTIQLEGNFQYTVMNLVGEVVFNGRGTDKKEIDLDRMASGAYFLKVVSEGNEKTIKLVKK